MHIQLQRLCTPAVKAPEPVSDAVDLWRNKGPIQAVQVANLPSRDVLPLWQTVSHKKEASCLWIEAYIVLCHTIIL